MSKPLRVLILRSNPVAPDPRVEKEARCLVTEGYSVQILCWDREGVFPPVELREGSFRINREKILATYGTGLTNLPALIRWQIRLLMKLIHLRKTYDVIHACDFDTVLPAVLMKIVFKKKVVYDIFDFYADHLRNTPGWIKKLIRKFDLRVINFVDGVILVDANREQQISGSSPSRLTFVYNSPEDVFSTFGPVNSHREKTLSVTYVGLLQWERGLLSLINTVKENPAYHLDIAGFGGDQEAVAKAAQDHPNIEFYGRIQYDQALALSEKADLIWALYDPTIPNHKFASPNKLFEAMMLGKPVIVARDTNIDVIVQDLDCGYVVNYDDDSAIQRALHSCASNYEDRIKKGRNARKAYEKKYSWGIMENRLLDLYATLFQ